MKLEGNVAALTKDIDVNKRTQLPPALATAKTEKREVGRPRIANPKVVYCKTRLELPESLKIRLDTLFARHRDLRQRGKNNLLI